MTTPTPSTKDLALPRILYKGPDDQHVRPAPHAAVPLGDVLATAQETDRLVREDEARRQAVTETVRVETLEDLEAKLKAGWRLRRALEPGDAPHVDAELPSPPAEADEPKPAPKRKT